MSERWKNVLGLVASIALCQCAGLIGSMATAPAIPTWYAGLAKPFFTPPGWLFAPAWIALYTLMGIAAYLVWRKGKEGIQVKKGLAAFGIQLVLNALWSPAFFGLRSPLSGMIVIVALWIAIMMTIQYFLKISRAAVALLVPYILWVTFAALLNASILVLNL